MTGTEDEDFAKVDKELAKELLRLAEVRLQAMITMTVASNQRAATLLGIFSTASIASLGACIAAITSKQESANYYTAGLCCMWMFIAAVLCVMSLWPAEFYYPGGEPEAWFTTDGALTDPLHTTQLYLAKQLDRRIKHNGMVLKRSAKHIKYAMIISIETPPICIGTWSVLHYFFSGGF